MRRRRGCAGAAMEAERWPHCACQQAKDHKAQPRWFSACPGTTGQAARDVKRQGPGHVVLPRRPPAFALPVPSPSAKAEGPCNSAGDVQERSWRQRGGRIAPLPVWGIRPRPEQSCQGQAHRFTVHDLSDRDQEIPTRGVIEARGRPSRSCTGRGATRPDPHGFLPSRTGVQEPFQSGRRLSSPLWGRKQRRGAHQQSHVRASAHAALLPGLSKTCGHASLRTHGICFPAPHPGPPHIGGREEPVRWSQNRSQVRN